jgi:hypothetical protein
MTKLNNNILEKNPEFFVPGMKAQCDASAGRILRGDNAGDRAIMLRPITLLPWYTGYMKS